MPTNLSIDIGNTAIKLAVINKTRIIFKDTHFEPITIENLKVQISQLFDIFNFAGAIVSSVRNDYEIVADIFSNFKQFEYLTHQTPVPIKNLYETPDTLGKDRLAAAVGATVLFPNQNVLIFDVGTALTVDFVNFRGEYLGGTISPGIQMRIRALHEFTQKLPLVKPQFETMQLFGTNTISAIEAGVKNGILYETEGYIRRFSEQYSDLHVIFTGGDLFFFEKNIKNSIFAEPDLIHIGLNRILEYNA